MFSIAAINDTGSNDKWVSLAPSKEAQEFHLSKIYHEGLLKLQAKEYEKARELLESILKDPMIVSVQVDNNATDEHLVQLRFLALKNLASVFCQLGPSYSENALRCYLEAVQIDAKDSVLWNQLGTFSCSLGLLSISRWAFEQGLICSPKNWNFMEKLLEVLIAIGDEVACLSVVEVILSHWPSHSRALHVKETIEDLNVTPFSPRGIDRLEPKNPGLKFVDKRIRMNERVEGRVCKRLRHHIEVQLSEVSWSAIADELVGILRSFTHGNFEQDNEKPGCSWNARLIIHLPSSSTPSIVENTSSSDLYPHNPRILSAKELTSPEEQPLERRSTRLERLRNRKQGKEELEFSPTRNLSDFVTRYLQPFVSNEFQKNPFDDVVSSFFKNPEVFADSSDIDHIGISKFVSNMSENYGACHVGHLLLEEIAVKCPSHHNSFVNFLQLDKLTRDWGQERSPRCSLFLAELCYDFGICQSDTSLQVEYMSEATFHLCKIIEYTSLDLRFKPGELIDNINGLSTDGDKVMLHVTTEKSYFRDLFSGIFSTEKYVFWVRFFWMSGQLSKFELNREKAHHEFCVSLLLLSDASKKDGFVGCITRPYCKVINEITEDRVLYDINMLEVDHLLDGTVGEMMSKGMHTECVGLLAPLVLSRKPVYKDILCNFANRSIELSALDVVIQSCEKKTPLDAEVFLNSHRRKLELLLEAAIMEGSFSPISVDKLPSFKTLMFCLPLDSNDGSGGKYNDLVAEEVNIISKCVCEVKDFIDSCIDRNSLSSVARSVNGTQSILLTVMSIAAAMFLSRKFSGSTNADQMGEKQRCCFVDAAIAFCKLQHLVSVSIKSQVELIVVMHELLAEYGLCCAGKNDQGEEGIFLKFAIKHLLALDINLKSRPRSPIRSMLTSAEVESHKNKLVKMSETDVQNDEVHKTEIDETVLENSLLEEVVVKDTFSYEVEDKLAVEAADYEVHPLRDNDHEGEKEHPRPIHCDALFSVEEREELELAIDNALDQCFFCLYGLNLRSDSLYEDELIIHRNTSCGDYQTMEQCADVFQYVLPFAKTSPRTRFVKLRRVLRAIWKHFPQPPEDLLVENPIEKFLDDHALCEDKLSEAAGCDDFPDLMRKALFRNVEILSDWKALCIERSAPYFEVYCNLYYLLVQSEDTSATDKWPGFVLTKEGEEFVKQNANIYKYDLLYNPLRFESWQGLANIYDEEVDLLLNDGSKHINVVEWWNDMTLTQRVEASRRRSRRCLLMSLALAKTSSQQSEIHELLALVYYDSLQNVVPLYDQRSTFPSKEAAWVVLCRNSEKHFKDAYAHKEDWSYAFYMGKLNEKLGSSPGLPLSYYDKAIILNPAAVDAVYRMHASRLKLLFKCGKQNINSLKILNAYCFSQAKKEFVTCVLDKVHPICSEAINNAEKPMINSNVAELSHMNVAWNILYDDCFLALQTCVEGDLKHFHKARYMLAKALYWRMEKGDLEKAKDELSFCFKSSRWSFTVNMWEIEGSVKKGRRKALGISTQKKTLEVNLSESSRKFITCLRKYVMFYLKLLEETRDVYTFDRAYTSIRNDKRFSLSLEDLVPVALGRYVKTLVLCMNEADGACTSEYLWEKLFNLFLEHWNIWPDLCGLPEVKCDALTENNLYRYLNRYIEWLEKKTGVEIIEGVVEKMRKRFKNPKSLSSVTVKLLRNARVAWYRSILVRLALITPTDHAERDVDVLFFGCSDSDHQLHLYLQTDEIWSSLATDDSTHVMQLRANWYPLLSKFKKVVVRKAMEKDLEVANFLLRCCYNFYRDGSYSQPALSGLNLCLVSFSAMEILDLDISHKLLLWAYTLFHGQYANAPSVIKYCEENIKVKLRKAVVSSNDTGGRHSDTDASVQFCSPAASTSSPNTHTVHVQTDLFTKGET